MPKTSMSSALARLKTSLNSRVCDPSTGIVSLAMYHLNIILTFLVDVLPLDWLP
jgi:hypothetical protein